MAGSEIKRKSREGLFRVDLEIRSSTKFTMSLESSIVRVFSSDSSHLLNKPAEAACLSGIGYARRILRADAIEVKFKEVSGRCDPGDVEGFAVASMLAFGVGLGRQAELLHLIPNDYEIVADWGAQRRDGDTVGL